MGGFAGMLRENSWIKLNLSSFSPMCEALIHRGPDDQGFYQDEEAMLGYRHIASSLPSCLGQPLHRNQYVIVYDGTLYNYSTLRQQLEEKGCPLESEAEAEVILALFEEYKEKVVDQLRGMFSFIIYDKQSKEMFGARDPFGIKPFYYRQTKDFFYAASEAKSLLKVIPPEERALEPKALQDYLTFQYVPGSGSMEKTIQQVPPGHYFWKSKGAPLNICRYFRPLFKPGKTIVDTATRQILAALRESVKVHLASDQPTGAFLSGGIDSTAIVALAKEINPHLKTFTVGFKEPGYSEVDVARQTAHMFNVEHHAYIIEADEVLKELPKIIYHLDQPVADPAAIPLYFAAQKASKQVKVVLSGEGADELFAGYQIYQEPLALKPLAVLPNRVKRALKWLARLLPDELKGKNYILRGCTPLEERYIGNAKLFDEPEKAHLLKKYCSQSPHQRWTRALYREASQHGYDPVTTMQYIDLNTWLVGDILVKADRMSMAHAVELRMPFLDKQVFNVAASLEPRQKVNRKLSKVLLRQALQDVLPSHVINRTKLGFPVPIRHWLKRDWYEWAYQLIMESDTDELLHKEKVLGLLAAHRKGEFESGVKTWTSFKGKHDYSRLLWAVITFILWHQIFVEQRYPWTKPAREEKANRAHG